MIILKNLICAMLLLFLTLGLATLRIASAGSPMAGSSANAETYAVTGVASEDVLNIRERPEASAAMVGAIPANGVGIRLLGPTEQKGRSTWREIEYQGMRGWVNARFLAVKAVAQDSQGLEMDLRCLGTEPFWSVHIQGSQMELDHMGAKTNFSVSTPTVSANHTNIWSMTFANAANDQHGVAFLERSGHCSDDMSDHRYQYTFRLLLGDDAVLSGCCNRIP